MCCSPGTPEVAGLHVVCVHSSHGCTAQENWLPVQDGGTCDLCAQAVCSHQGFQRLAMLIFQLGCNMGAYCTQGNGRYSGRT